MNLRSNSSENAFNVIKRLTILHPSKRDADIVKSLINNNGEIISNSNKILLKCLQQMECVSGKIEERLVW